MTEGKRRNCDRTYGVQHFGLLHPDFAPSPAPTVILQR